MVYCEAELGEIFKNVPKHGELFDVSGKLNKYLVCIGGPTAVGKTSVAIGIASHLNTEILSADSRQIFREMTIGTAKPTERELATVLHHFIGTLSVEDSFSAGDFERGALSILESIFAQNQFAVMCGGTGFYHNAVLFGLDSFPDVPIQVRNKWERAWKENGVKFLQKEIETVDIEYFNNVDLNNHIRLIRALSVIEASGRPFSSFLRSEHQARTFTPIRIFLNLDRSELYSRIDRRVEKMIDDGLVDEAQRLYPYRHNQALNTVGYKELFEHFDGELSFEEAIDKIKQHSRNYAKRQITWFRNQEDWQEFDSSEVNPILSYIHAQTQTH